MTQSRTLLAALACFSLAALSACHDKDDQPPGGFHQTVTTTKPKPTPPTQLPPDGDQEVANATPPPTPRPSVENAQPNPAPTPAAKRDYPYGVPVEGKPGFVTSPYAPEQGYVDVHGFTPGQEVRDPFTGKIFLVP